MRNLALCEKSEPIVGLIEYDVKLPHGCVPKKQYENDMNKIVTEIELLKRKTNYFLLVLEEGDEEIVNIDEYCHLKLVDK